MMLPTRSSTFSYSLSTLSIHTHHRLHVFNSRFLLANPKQKLQNCQFSGAQRLKISTTSLDLHYANNKKYMSVVDCGVAPEPNVPSDHSSGSWKLWIVGMLITAILPLWGNKLWPLIKLKDKEERVVETAEHVTEIVEKAAEAVEKVAEEVADHLPVDGKLKEAVTFVENVAKDTEKDAHLAEEVIDKVKEVEKEAQSLIDSVVDETNEITGEARDHNNQRSSRL